MRTQEQTKAVGTTATILGGKIEMRSVELFVGAGGLAMGVSYAGFKHDAVIEIDQNACSTITANQLRGVRPVVSWPLHKIDVREFDFRIIPEGLDLLAGGPPCQPFSLGGKHLGNHDSRDMFPTAVSIVRKLKPRAFLFENVKGLTRSSFAKYFKYIELQLTYPEIILRHQESWTEHMTRLERYHTRGKPQGLYYRVLVGLLNAADYGVPQKRERVIIVGFRSDIHKPWSFPPPTHSLNSLLYSQWVTGDYWDLHKVRRNDRPEISVRWRNRVEKLVKTPPLPFERPWKTVRDALRGLPDPRKSRSHGFLNHEFLPGARSYPGHTGSILDEPAKTLKAGDHGVPGGENMLALTDGNVRYFTVRESARLQTFPDEFVFTGSWTETMRQLGNAVPVDLGEVIAKSIRTLLE
jgi:DNA (cytosine-5)-methyltransferase 1